MSRTLAAVFLLLASPASAMTLILDEKPDLLVVDEPAQVHWIIHATCRELAARGTPDGTQIQLDAVAAPYLLIDIEQTLIAEPCDTQEWIDNKKEIPFSYGITATTEAPGLVNLPGTVSVRLGPTTLPGDPTAGIPQVQEPIQHAVAFQSRVQAIVGEPIPDGRGTWQVPVELANFGNSRTQLSFSVDASGYKVAVPNDVILDSPNHGDEGITQATVMVPVFDAPIGREPLTIQIEVTSAVDPEQSGEPLVVSTTVNGGLLRSVPGPGMPVTLLAIAFIARKLQ